MMNVVGIITRVISVAADATVLGFTLWKTFYVFKMNKQTRNTAKITYTLAYNGDYSRLSLEDLYLICI